MSRVARVVLVLQAVLAAQKPTTETIEGRVVDLRGEPVRVAEVTVTTWQQPQTVLARGLTDGDGYFRIGRVPTTEGRQLTASRSGRCGETVRIGSGNVPKQVLMHDATTVRGVVLDGNGEPVSNVPVRGELISRAMRDVHSDGITDSEGQFVLKNVPLGVVRFQALIPGERLAVHRVTIAGEAEIRVTPLDMPTTTMRMLIKGLPAEAIAHLRPMVLPYSDGRLGRFPAPWNQPAFDDDATWNLKCVPDCRYLIYLHAEGFLFAPRQFTLTAGSGPHELKFVGTAITSDALRCRSVVRGNDGKPVQGVAFEMRASDGGNRAQATSNQDGELEFRSPLAIGAKAIVYSTTEQWVIDQEKTPEMSGSRDARFLKWHEWVIDPNRTLQLRVVPATSVRGRVMQEDGRPASFVRVQLQASHSNRVPHFWMTFAYATTDRDGNYAFRRLHHAPGDVQILVESVLGSATSESRSIAEIGTKINAPDIKLAAPASIEGVVRDKYDQPMAGIAIWLRDWDMSRGRQASGSVTEVVTDRLGRYRFVGVPTGGAYLQLVQDQAARRKVRVVEPFEVEAGKNYSFDLVNEQ